MTRGSPASSSDGWLRQKTATARKVVTVRRENFWPLSPAMQDRSVSLRMTNRLDLEQKVAAADISLQIHRGHLAMEVPFQGILHQAEVVGMTDVDFYAGESIQVVTPRLRCVSRVSEQ